MPIDLLFMPDYSADPVWDPASEWMVNLDELPIMEGTRVAIRAWAARWEARAWQELASEDAEEVAISGSSEPVTPEASEAIERDGLLLCQRLRNELGDDWRVGPVSLEDNERSVQWETYGPVTPLAPGEDVNPNL